MEDLARMYGSEVAELVQAQHALSMEVDAGDKEDTILVNEGAPATQLDVSGVNNQEDTQPVTLVPFSIVRHVYRRWLEGAVSETAMMQIYGETWLEAFRLIRDQGLPAGRVLLEHLVRWDVSTLLDEGEDAERTGLGSTDGGDAGLDVVKKEQGDRES